MNGGTCSPATQTPIPTVIKKRTASNQKVRADYPFHGWSIRSWREIDLMLPNYFLSAIWLLESLEQRLRSDETLRIRYQETIDSDVKEGNLPKIDQTELNHTRDKLKWRLAHHVINPHKPRKSQVHAKQQQTIKVWPSMTKFYLVQVCCSVWSEFFLASQSYKHHYQPT